MSGGLEGRYRRLLRAYPSAWRSENEEVVLGLLDVAEAEGRERPAPGERWVLATDGVAHRLDRRVSIVAAVTAFGAATAGAAAYLFAAVELASIGLGWLASALLLLIVPIGLVVSVSALLRSTHRVGPRSALAAILFGAPSSGAAFVAAVLWSVGFEAADAGRPTSEAENLLLLGCVVVAWVLGAATIWVLSRPLVGRGVLATVGGLAAAVVSTPIIGFALFSPLTGIVFAAGAVVLALVAGRTTTARTTTGQADAPRVQAPPDVPPASLPGYVMGTAPLASGFRGTPLLTAALAAGLVAVVVALTGSLWLPALDGTEAMNLGLGLGSLAAAVTVGVAALALVRSGALPWPGAVAAVLGPVVTGGGQLVAGMTGIDPWTFWMIGSALVGVAVATLVARFVRRRYPATGRIAAVASGVLAGLGYAVIPGIVVTAYLPFIAPIVAGILVLSRRGRRRTPRELSPTFTPSF
ncbi:hypothetical protein [Labedella endophytica]|uniref:Uncharacterized protein n=1 Tax=Labedella endophytica TaxID=1523160 RepID=A0A3S0VID5_9MICO|nr:hypothetical protein [Labedella endophytica]RUR03231.1 hypothetical protein ELQ94_01365 [Labedella endophytica]